MSPLRLGCCITAHGLGHASRSLAVMEALSSLADVHFTVVSMVPEWFIHSASDISFTCHRLRTDIGLVQHSPFHEDIPATIRELKGFYPFSHRYIEQLAGLFGDCELVLCDIAPAGIVAARHAGIPSVLVENFTWDWIYQAYCEEYAEIKPFVQLLRDLFAQADYRIQTVPVCEHRECDLRVGPVSRRFRQKREATRCRLDLDEAEKVVLVSMGGDSVNTLYLQNIEGTDARFLVPGKPGAATAVQTSRVVSVDMKMYHPDLVAASDAVIGKVGYSTLAEVYHAGVPFGYIGRSRFRESGPLTDFIKKEMAAVEITEKDLSDGSLSGLLPDLLTAKGPTPRYVNGAYQCAEFLLGLLGRGRELA